MEMLGKDTDLTEMGEYSSVKKNCLPAEAVHFTGTVALGWT